MIKINENKMKESYNEKSPFWDKYLEYAWELRSINNPIIDFMNNIISERMDGDKNYQLDLGTGMGVFSEDFPRHAQRRTYSDKYFNEKDRVVHRKPYIKLDFSDQDKVIETIQKEQSNVLTSFFALELYQSREQCAELYQRAFDETDVKCIVTSGIMPTYDRHRKVVEDNGVECYTSGYFVFPKNAQEYTLQSRAPSDLFGKNWMNCWRILCKK